MTLFEVEELTSYWAEHPPLHLLVAAYLRPGSAKRSSVSTSSGALPHGGSSDVTSILTGLGPGFFPGDVHAGLSAAVLDFSELHRRAARPIEPAPISAAGSTEDAISPALKLRGFDGRY
jgi:hypothetical protein